MKLLNKIQRTQKKVQIGNLNFFWPIFRHFVILVSSSHSKSLLYFSKKSENAVFDNIHQIIVN